jgi:integral membrane protein
MAWIVGVLLVILVFIGVPLKYFADTPQVVAVTHGMLYLVYLATGLDLAVRRRWKLPKVLLVFAAGLVPFLTFYVEHRVVSEERSALPR